MSLVSDSERERAASSLRQQYLYGRLSTEQLAERVELARAARHRRDLHQAFAGLPPSWRDVDEVRRVARLAKRAAVRALIAGAWALLTLILLIGFALNSLVHGVATPDVIVFFLAWLFATALAWRARRRA